MISNICIRKWKNLLQETYGVMVYQEDVIKVAHHFGGLDLAEADVLRRAMSGKYRGRKQFEDIKSNFFQNCRDRKYPGIIPHRKYGGRSKVLADTPSAKHTRRVLLWKVIRASI